MEPPGAPYSTLDESSLRALLDETLDLDQRRLIRSALREVRRREIQDMEAALLSKRHRPSRRCTQEDKEDKENQHMPCSSDALHLLAQKVQEIRDLEELSTMLRSAPEYEERRIIRAAIRSIREHQEEQQEEKRSGIRSIREHQEEQQEEKRSGIRSIREQQKEEQEEKGPGIREQQQEQQEEKGPGIRSIREEYSHVRRRRAEEEQRPEGGALEPQSTSTPHRPDSYKTGSCPGMMLVIGPQLKDEGPLPLLIQGSREALPSGASDLNQEALPSGASDLNQEALPSGASDLNQEALPSGALEPCASVCSDGKGPTDSEGESRAPALRAIALQDQTDGAMISTKDSVRGRLDQKITVNNSLSSRKHKDTELTLGLKASPFRISSTLTAPSVMMESESPSQLVLAPPSQLVLAPPSQLVLAPPSQLVLAPPSQLVLAPPSVGGATDLSNGGLPNAEECSSKVTPEFLAAIDDEETLDQMLDGSKDFEERRMIRAAMRDLRKRKRDQREKEREVRLQEQRQQRDQRDHRDHRTASRPGTEGVVIKKLESADGSTLSQVTKTNTFSQSDGSRSTLSTVTSYVHKTDRGTVQSKSFSFSSSTSSSTSSNTKVGSVFEREDSSVSRSSVVAAEKKKKEVQRSQTMTSSSLQARKALMERLDSSGGPAVVKINRVQRSTSFGVPNANTIKQMLLDWCRAKTRGYQHVEIQNFSSSWSSGMAFCALVHHFFPEAFDYSALQPSERRHNFELAFSTAERTVDCPQLLDVEDMVKLREPDWKCVYTYLQEFYRGLVTKGLVRTRANAS